MKRILSTSGAVLYDHGHEAPAAEVVSAAIAAGDNLARANLRGAILAGANLANTNLAGAILRGAILARANLRGAILAGADLAGADLARADLARADLAGAILTGAILTGANLIHAIISAADIGTRSDGYRFILLAQPDSEPRIQAGCRNFSLSEARAHWAIRHVGTPLHAEMQVILDHAERIAKIRGWL